MAIIKLISVINNAMIEFEDTIIGAGAMKDVYFSPDKTYVVQFIRSHINETTIDRLMTIVKVYHPRIFNQIGGEYWNKLYCFPYDIVVHEGKLGLVAPAYQKHFFFEYGSKNNDFMNIKGKEKDGKWFASANLRSKFLDDREKGNWQSYFRICILISRAVKRLHAAGLAHSDLSYKNVLIDPSGGNAAVIDIDTLVVPGKFPPEVLGTPDFIAPEVLKTRTYAYNDTKRKTPCIETDRHALAVMIYSYLLYRHPLRGGKIHDLDSAKDEEMSMGENALFIEHPTDASNRPNLNDIKQTFLPWADVNKIPYNVAGPYLKNLFDKAFIDGLHNPSSRPTAEEWEIALVKTIDLMQPCQNYSCEQKYFVFDNKTKPICPFCGTQYRGTLPIINLYSKKHNKAYGADDHRLTVYNNQALYKWHIFKNIFPNEKLNEADKKRVGYFVFYNQKWYLVNENMPTLKDITENKLIPIKSHVELVNNKQILFDDSDNGRLAAIQIINN